MESKKELYVEGGSVSEDADHGYEAPVKFLEEITSKCDEVQENVLAEILAQNAETEYLKRYRMSHGHIDRMTFKTNMPIIAYEDIKPDILRMCNEGPSAILCAKPISEFWISTGTTRGIQKMFPVTEDEKERRDALHFSVMPYIKRCIEGENPYGGKTLSFLISREERVTPSGVKILAGSTSFFKNFKFYKDKPYPLNYNTSLKEAILCSDHFQSIYTQLLCGFYQRHDVTHIKSVFGSSLVSVVHFLKRHYSELCSDISSGALSPKITDPSLRGRMIETFMQNPDPELAKFIRVTCSDVNWEGIYRKIWPNIKYLDAVLTGSMAQYILLLKYYTGGLPLLSTKYSASECDLGFNLNPMCDPYDVSYTIMPNMSYYEFLPLDSSHFTSSDPKPLTVEMADVEVGKEYEVVVTNFCGLYRYRIGDVLSPTGFFNSTPQFKFVRRENVILNIDVCKLSEMELQNSIDSVSSLLGQLDIKVVDHTSYANVKDAPGHCVIYMELMVMSQANWPKPEVLEQCCQAMEGSLGPLYLSTRVSGFIGPLEIRVVENGTFEKLRDYAISKGASFMQYKVPRCVKALDVLELLNSGVVSVHFSSSFPPSGP